MQQFAGKSGRLTAWVVGLAMSAHVVPARDSAAQTAAAVDDGAQTLAQRVAAGTWDRFTAHVTVRRQRVNDAGVAVGPPMSDHEYVWERELTTGGWTNRVTVLERPGPTVRTAQGVVPLSQAQIADKMVARIEDNEDGSAPRFFNRQGVELRPSWRPLTSRPGDAGAGALTGVDPTLVASAAGLGPTRRPPGREWVTAFVMLPGRASTRLQAVTKPFGRRAGWVRGYGRYVRDDGSRRLELLVDEQDGVPVEANIVEGGALRSHTTFRYERSGTGALVRRGVRVELAAPVSAAADPAAATRVVTDVSYSDVRLRTKGGR